MTQRFGKFILVDRLAVGGMGEIFLVRQQGIGQFERQVVLKRLRPEFTDDSGFESLFLEEARISARFSHPNVVQVYEFGRVADCYFLTLEYVRGLNLNAITQQLLGRGDLWPLEVLVEGVSSETEHLLEGRHHGMAPEVDGRLLINDGYAPAGTYVDVEITDAFASDLVGRIVGPRGADEVRVAVA